ncbi:hypothetical protein [Piscinibacter sp.]
MLHADAAATAVSREVLAQRHRGADAGVAVERDNIAASNRRAREAAASA